MPNAYRNESHGKYRLLHYTKWSKGGGIEVRSRLVVIAFPSVKGEFGKYAVRYQNYDGATWGGASFNSHEEAHRAFLEKYLDHNRSFRKGNISHLPGIVK